jgi:hypothetical protein
VAGSNRRKKICRLLNATITTSSSLSPSPLSNSCLLSVEKLPLFREIKSEEERVNSIDIEKQRDPENRKDYRSRWMRY